MAKTNLGEDPFNIIITGVGGQGNVVASKILAGMLIRQGFRVTIGETFGVSQRGGSVMSHIRVSEKSVLSPQVPRGRAHVVVTLEPIEAIRVLATYGNERVKVITNTRAIYPVSVIAGQLSYPTLPEIKEAILKLSAKAWFIGATEEAVNLGNPILGNIIIIGALAGTGEIFLPRAGFQDVIREMLGEDKLKDNLKAFDLGRILVGSH